MAESYSVNAVFGIRDQLTSKLSSISQKLGEVAEKPKKISAGLGTILKGAGVFSLVNKGISLMSANLGGAVSRFDKLNNFPKVMKIMGASTEDSTKAMKRMSDAIDGLPTSLDDMASTAQQLFPIVGNNINKASESAIALNNAFLASGASGEDASRGLQQYTQMLSAGKVDMQSWKTLQETMPYALQETAKSFGIASGSSQDLYKKLKSGEITMTQLNDKFIELNGGTNGFAEVAKTATGGIGTAFVNLGNRVKKGLADMIKKLDEASVKLTGSSIASHISDIGNAIKNVLSTAGDKIAKFAAIAKPYIDVVKQAFTKMGPAIHEAIQAVADSLSVMNNQVSNSKPPIDGFKDAMNGVVNVVKKVSAFIRDNSDKVASLIRALPKLIAAWAGLKVAIGVSRDLSGGLSKILKVAEKIAPKLSKVGTAAGNTMIGAAGAIETFGARASDLSGTLGNVIRKFPQISRAANIMRQNGTPALSAMRKSIMAFVPETQNSMVALGQMQRRLAALVGNIFPSLLSKIKGISSAIVSFVTHPLSSVKTAFSMFASAGTGAIRAVGSAFVSNPIGLVITAIVAAVALLAIAWKRNFGNIQTYTKAVFGALGKSLSTIGNLFKPMLKSLRSVGSVLKPMMPLFGALGALLGGAFAISLGVVVDAFRGLAAGVATVVIAISTLIKAIAKGGSAIGKFFSGDFKGAAKDAKGSIDTIGQGINEIKDTWSEFGKGSATVGVVKSFSTAANEVKKTGEKAKQTKQAFDTLSKSGTAAAKNLESGFRSAQDAMQGAFDSGKMTHFNKSVTTLFTRFQESSKKAYDTVSKISEASGTKRITLANKAMSQIVDIQKNGNESLLAVMRDGSRMLAANKDLEGNTLTAEQREALQQQNQAARDAMMEQQQIYIQAAQAKIAAGQQLSKDEQTALKSNLNALAQNERDTITSNNERITALKAQMASASTDADKANYQAQIDALNASNKQQETALHQHELAMLGETLAGGQLTNQQLLENLQQAGAITDQQMEQLLGKMNQGNANMQQKMLLIAQTMKNGGITGADALVQAIANKDYDGVAASINFDIENKLSELPTGMFTEGATGRDKFIAALKSGDFEGAGTYLSDQTNLGASKAKTKVGESGKRAADEAVRQIKQRGPDAKAAGTVLGDSTAKGINAKKATVGDAGDTLGYHLAKGVRGRKYDARDAGDTLGYNGAAGARSRRDDFFSTGKYLGDGLAAGLNASLGSVTNAANQLVAQADRAAKAKAKIKSPSRLFRDEIGKYLALGVAQGINDYSGEAEEAAGKMIERTRAQASTGVDLAFATNSRVDVNAGSGLMKMLSSIMAAIQAGKNLYLDDGTLVGATAPAYDQALGSLTANKGRYQL